MSRRLFNEVPEFGIRRWFHYDDDTDTARIEVEQDVEGMFDSNAERQAQASGTRWGEMAHVARIPLSIYSEWLAQGKHRDQAFLKRWLNDRDNRRFRVRLGKV